MRGLMRYLLVLLPVILTAFLAVSFIDVSSSSAAPNAYYYFPMAYSHPPQLNGTLIIENLDSGAATVEVYMQGYGNIPCNPVNAGSPVQLTLPAGTGLLSVNSLDGKQLLVSQLVEEKGNYSQVYATSGSQLDTSHLFGFYDTQSSGTSTSLVVANPGATTTDVSVYIAGAFKESHSIEPGLGGAFSFPSTLGGPVKLISTNGQPFVTNELVNINNQFISVSKGISESSLTDHAYMPLYDFKTAGTDDGVLIENPNGFPIYYEARIGGTSQGSGTLNAGATATVSVPDLKSGPIDAQAWTDSGKSGPANVFVSQRIMQNGRFWEEYGIQAASAGASSILAWHDGDPATQLQTTLAVANTGSSPANVEIFIGGSVTPDATASINANSATTFPIDGKKGGPVKVNCTNGQTIVASEILPTLQAPAKNFYFPWYDNVWGKTWVMMAQPSAGSLAAQDNLFGIKFRNDITKLDEALAPASSISVLKGKSQDHLAQNKIGGPVQVVSDKGDALVSERSLFGNSFEEVWATPYNRLDSHYWWPIYDNQAIDGMKNWILVANPQENTDAITTRVKVYNNGSLIKNETHNLSPGESWTPKYDENGGLFGGPVEVTAWRQSGNENNGADARNVIASQRVLYNGAFNEMPGIANNALASIYLWTWFDDLYGKNWVVVTNPDPVNTVFAGVTVGDPTNPGSVRQSADIPPLHTYAFREPLLQGQMSGPVSVVGFQSRPTHDNPRPPLVNLIATQRILWGPSFGEIAGTSLTDVSYSSSNWTWYDQSVPGVTNWVLINNPQSAAIDVEVRIKGEAQWIHVDGEPDSKKKTIQGHHNITPTFPGMIGGPVEVYAWQSGTNNPRPVFASQRVLWNGYFNEVVGKGM